MARYTPPPNWPPPPPGWTPPEGWRPEPGWGPAPEGWDFWADDRSWFARNRALSITGGVAVLLLLVCCGVGIAAAPGRQSAPRSPASSPASAATRSPAPSPASPTVSPPPAAPPAVVVPQVVVPDVVGRRLTAATSVLAAAGLRTVDPVDASGQDRVVINPANWVVRAQTPAAGARVPPTATITLRVRKPTDGAGSTSVSAGVVPDVVCQDLQAAQDTLQAAGFYNLRSEYATGHGRHQVIDRNWVVVAQSARAGSTPPVAARIVLRAVKLGEPTGTSGCPS